MHDTIQIKAHTHSHSHAHAIFVQLNVLVGFWSNKKMQKQMILDIRQKIGKHIMDGVKFKEMSQKQ